MCTLILGLGILGPGSLVLGGNRDESPKRPSADPGVLVESPRVVGGRDLVSRGTWLAIREARFVTALMNRRPWPGDRREVSSLRSRGMLCLDAAVSGDLEGALMVAIRDAYAPCTLVGVGAGREAWAIQVGPEKPRVRPMDRGWHVITHQELDDPNEPRTKWILEDIARKEPGSVEEAFDLLAGYLRWEGGEGRPAVCLHRESFPTVSSTLLALGVPDGSVSYRHSSGPPCTTPYQDYTPLLTQGD